MRMTWQDHDLYAGHLYIGSIMRVVPERWRELGTYKNEPEPGTPEYVRKNIEITRAHHVRHEAMPWRGWLMTDEDGSEVGYWATEEEAKLAVEIIAGDYLRGLPSDGDEAFSV